MQHRWFFKKPHETSTPPEAKDCTANKKDQIQQQKIAQLVKNATQVVFQKITRNIENTTCSNGLQSLLYLCDSPNENLSR